MTNTPVHAMFAAIDRADWDALAGLLHPAAVYERPGYPPLAGRPRIMRFYREERQVVCGRHDVEGTVTESGQAAAWGRMRGTLRDGSSADLQFAEIYSVDGSGLIVHRRSYFFVPTV